MTDIEKRAREVAHKHSMDCAGDKPNLEFDHSWSCNRLTAAILTLTREAVEAERERCERIVSDARDGTRSDDLGDIEDAIRARDTEGE